jgi:hypoxanthine phosphoribosyltransferase
MLSHLLGIQDLESISLKYTDSAREHLVTVGPIPTAKNGDQILLIEDFLLSGKSLRCATELLQCDKSTVKTAALGYLPSAVVAPDYSLGIADMPPSFPWE